MQLQSGIFGRKYCICNQLLLGHFKKWTPFLLLQNGPIMYVFYHYPSVMYCIYIYNFPLPSQAQCKVPGIRHLRVLMPQGDSSLHTSLHLQVASNYLPTPHSFHLNPGCQIQVTQDSPHHSSSLHGPKGHNNFPHNLNPLKILLQDLLDKQLLHSFPHNQGWPQDILKFPVYPKVFLIALQ